MRAIRAAPISFGFGSISYETVWNCLCSHAMCSTVSAAKRRIWKWTAYSIWWLSAVLHSYPQSMLHKWFEPKAEPKSWNHLKEGRNHFVFISLSSVGNSFFLLVKWLYETSSADCSPHDPLLQKPDHRTLQLISTSLLLTPFIIINH